MSEVWIVECTYFNGEGDSVRFGGVFSTEELAIKFCEKKNKEKTSSYSDSYDVIGSTKSIVKSHSDKGIEMYIEGNHVFGVLKQNLEVDQRVIFGRTSDPNLDGLIGTIVGQSSDNICDFYIVLLDTPYLGQKAINITEACLSKI